MIKKRYNGVQDTLDKATSFIEGQVHGRLLYKTVSKLAPWENVKRNVTCHPDGTVNEVFTPAAIDVHADIAKEIEAVARATFQSLLDMVVQGESRTSEVDGRRGFSLYSAKLQRRRAEKAAYYVATPEMRL